MLPALSTVTVWHDLSVGMAEQPLLYDPLYLLLARIIFSLLKQPALAQTGQVLVSAPSPVPHSISDEPQTLHSSGHNRVDHWIVDWTTESSRLLQWIIDLPTGLPTRLRSAYLSGIHINENNKWIIHFRNLLFLRQRSGPQIWYSLSFNVFDILMMRGYSNQPLKWS